MKKPCHYYVATFCEALSHVNKHDVACEIQEIVMSNLGVEGHPFPTRMSITDQGK